MWAGCGTEIVAGYRTLPIKQQKQVLLPEVICQPDMKEERKIDQVIQLSNYRQSPCQFPDADFGELQYVWKVHESGFGSLAINCEFKLFIFFN